MSLSTRRPLLQALAVSLLVHAILLWDVAGFESPQLAAPARLLMVSVAGDRHATRLESAAETRATRPAEPKESRHEERPVEKRDPTPSPRHELVTAKEAPIHASRSPEPAPSTAASVEPTPSTNVSVASGGQIEAPGGRPLPPLASAVGSPSAGTPAKTAGRGNTPDGVSTNDVAQYRMTLGQAARRFKRYPPLAREREWEGTVEIALYFRARIAQPEITLAQSSGRSILDEQALETVRQAVRETIVPENLRGREFPVKVPVVFSLEDSQ
jgi:protein TonB